VSLTKPLILLVPGLDGTGGLYEPQIPALEEHFRVCAVRFQSIPGFGFPDLVRELEAETGAEPPGSITVVGESFGGPVAVHFALAFPERVRLLVLINTFSYYRWRLRIRLACLTSPLLRAAGFRQVKDFIAGRLLRWEGIDPVGLDRYYEVIRRVDLGAYRRRLELVREVDLRHRLGEIRIPTLILASGADKIVPSAAEAHFMASKIPTAQVREFPRAGHALLLTPGFSLSDYVSPHRPREGRAV
jgi:pimeloyl-ACP methyl ester carboxylesterase